MESLSSLQYQVIPHSTLLSYVNGYARPNAKIHKLRQQSQLLPLKKGLYALSGKQAPSKELVANHLLGPSYVSRQWALSYYGLLTERVVEVTSMCIGRSKQFDNALGRFSYHAVPAHYYSLGHTSILQADSAFMMATPEKALCDLLISVRNLRLQSTSAMLTYLLEDLRLDEDDLLELKSQSIQGFMEAGYKTTMLANLVDALEVLHD
jgi:hypothetical protein